jgi:hypothetical protein
MPYYRIFRVDQQGHVSRPATVVDCPDDDSARESAKAMLDGADLEVWQEKRLVARLKSNESGK